MKLVVGAGVAVKWFTNEQWTEASRVGSIFESAEETPGLKVVGEASLLG